MPLDYGTSWGHVAPDQLPPLRHGPPSDEYFEHTDQMSARLKSGRPAGGSAGAICELMRSVMPSPFVSGPVWQRRWPANVPEDTVLHVCTKLRFQLAKCSGVIACAKGHVTAT